ncbi:MAG: LLM class flavin-dependent oxidoreductase [Clostridia bacterium]|nr:LLM class flavin-dependent oxidoreductase [Clostridia bacterium]
MNIRNEIRAQIVRAGFTMRELVNCLAEKYGQRSPEASSSSSAKPKRGWSRSVSNLSGKLTRETIQYREVVEIADILGYDLVWQERSPR